eukprot:m.116778 g.116778  ORF g.116778 m.116778 type:complete len:152 (-) comp10926_c1_seq1:907-1362(-)
MPNRHALGAVPVVVTCVLCTVSLVVPTAADASAHPPQRHTKSRLRPDDRTPGGEAEHRVDNIHHPPSDHRRGTERHRAVSAPHGGCNADTNGHVTSSTTFAAAPEPAIVPWPRNITFAFPAHYFDLPVGHTTTTTTFKIYAWCGHEYAAAV